MKTLLLFTLSFVLVNCAGMQKSQQKYKCSYSAAYNAGKADAALLNAKTLSIFKTCDQNGIEKTYNAYNQGYDHYLKNEQNQVGHINGKAGFGAGIQFVCVGTLFGNTFIGKGQNERIAGTHLKFNCNASDLSVHCSNMFVRCRRVNYGEHIRDFK